jgi:hypothetical protein
MENSSARSLIAVLAGAVPPVQFGLLLWAELGLFCREAFPFALATAMPSRVRMRSRSTSHAGEGGQDVDEHLAHRIGRVVDLSAA